MIILKKSEKKGFWALLLLKIIFLNFCLFSTIEIDPLTEMQKSFYVNVDTNPKGEISVEFNPDNTGFIFVVKKMVFTKDVIDFLFLYVYFFSDYIYHEKWRMMENPTLVAKQILAKSSYSVCNDKKIENKVRCILKKIMKRTKMKIFFVRYDEHKKNLVLWDFESLLISFKSGGVS